MNQATQNKKDSVVWALFGNGTATPVALSEGTASDSISCTSVGLSKYQIGVRGSAEKAIHSSVSCLQKFRHIQRNVAIHYGFSNNDNKIGESASLAFAVKTFAVCMGLSFDVAATGVVTSHESPGYVVKVARETIDSKISAAIEKLKPGDALLFPWENQQDIDTKLLERARAKGIRTKGVSSIEETMLWLLQETGRVPVDTNDVEGPSEGTKGIKRSTVALAGLLIMVICLSGVCRIVMCKVIGPHQEGMPTVFSIEALSDQPKEPLPEKEDSSYHDPMSEAFPENVDVSTQAVRPGTQPVTALVPDPRKAIQKHPLALKMEIMDNGSGLGPVVSSVLEDLFVRNGIVIRNKAYDGVVKGTLSKKDLGSHDPLGGTSNPAFIVAKKSLEILDLRIEGLSGQVFSMPLSSVVEDSANSVDETLVKDIRWQIKSMEGNGQLSKIKKAFIQARSST